MKTLRLATLSLAVAAILPSLTSCRSDESPFGWTISQQKADAIIQLKLNVAETRAAADETAISKLTVLVFDENDALETTKNVDVTKGSDIILEVSQGLKTVYVVTAQHNFLNSSATMQAFEDAIFDSTLDKIKGTDGFMMIGKSDKQLVMKAASEDALPASNVFSITVERLVAKAQVKFDNVIFGDFGIKPYSASFKAFQLNNKMRVVANGTEVGASNTHTNGTYDNYSIKGEGDYLTVVSSFDGINCAYMSENIVSNPVSGNTTFLGIHFVTYPEKYYTFDSATKKLTEIGTPTMGSTDDYYAVGIQDKEAGIVDYVLVSGSKKIATFKTEADAQAYANSLNGKETSATTVSQTDAPLMAPSLTRAASTFEVIKFDKGNVYYRVNITHTEDSKSELKVLRNRFYKVNINSVSTLGFSDDKLLRPTNPDTGLDTSSKYWISVNIDVAPWEEIEQNADL